MAKCPHCKTPITLDKLPGDCPGAPQPVRRQVKGLVKKEVMYSCPSCDMVLGFGFFFGGLLTGRP
jgi:hypothetical protein